MPKNKLHRIAQRVQDIIDGESQMRVIKIDGRSEEEILSDVLGDNYLPMKSDNGWPKPVSDIVNQQLADYSRDCLGDNVASKFRAVLRKTINGLRSNESNKSGR